MASLSIHSSDNPGIKVAPHYLNWFATNSYWRDAPLIGDDFCRSCMGTTLRWDILSLCYWLKTNFGRTPKEDVFQIGFGGSPEDTAINVSLHALQNNWQTLDDLPLSGEEKEMLLVLIKKWESQAGLLYSRETQGNPLPVPPPPEEPKPVPPPVILTPKPDLPATPEVPAKKFSWAWAKTAAAILAGISVVAGLFIPGWAKTILDAIIAILRSLGAM
jgi:hypothetical protein